MLRLFILLLPVIELVLLVRAGMAVGVLYLLAWILGTALLGMFFLRRQALGLLLQPQALQPGDDAARLLLDAPLRALAGLLLILPGFITDAIGLLLLLPFVRRRVLRRWLGKRILAGGAFQGGVFMGGASMGSAAMQDPPGAGASVIEGEYVVVRGDRPPPGSPPRIPPAK